MQKVLFFAVGIAAISATTVLAGSGKQPPGKRAGGSWGDVTAEAVEGGFPQGGHASDPSGDGHGPGTNDEPRAGLANAGGKRGDLSNTMDALGLNTSD